MAIEFVGSAVADNTGAAATYTIATNALTGGIASAAAAGDLLVIATGWQSTTDGNPGPQNGGGLTWTEVADLYVNRSQDTNLSVAYSYAASTPPTTVTVEGNSSTDASTVLFVFRGVDSSTPIDATTTTATFTDSTLDANPPSITPATTGATVIAIGACGVAAGASMTAGPSGYSGFLAKNAGNFSVAMAYIASRTGGVAEDPGAFTHNNSANGSAAAVTMAIRPSPDSGSLLFNPIPFQHILVR